MLKKGEDLAQRHYHTPPILAFSGGKDSQALYHIAEEAGISFEPQFRLTSIDPPEVLRFVHKNYPAVKFVRPPLTFWQICLSQKMMPSRSLRFCCKYLKEQSDPQWGCFHWRAAGPEFESEYAAGILGEEENERSAVLPRSIYPLPRVPIKLHKGGGGAHRYKSAVALDDGGNLALPQGGSWCP